MITDEQYKEAAALLRCEVAAVKAVTEVESSGRGFLPDGKVKILFEPHIFWQELKKRNITPVVRDICYPKWKTGAYGKMSEQWPKLERAVQINKDAALCSASWGLFQIMGQYWSETGVASLDEFVMMMKRTDYEHLMLFCGLILTRKLDDEMREKRWADFALRYNGSGYKANNYDTKLEAAYEKYS
jgi:N-acetylmuramidase